MTITVGQPTGKMPFPSSARRTDNQTETTLLEWALDEGARADIVFLAAHGQSELPATVKLWLKRWLTRRSSEPGALAISLDPSADALGRTQVRKRQEIPSPRAGLRQFHAQLFAAGRRRRGESQRRVQGRRFKGPRGQEREGQGEGRRGQGRLIEPALCARPRGVGT